MSAPVQFSTPRSIAYACFLVLAVFGIAEAGLRTWAHYFRGTVQRFDRETRTFVLIPGEHQTALGRVRINSQGFVGDPIQADSADLFRIVALGDSCTFGAGDETHTYPAKLQRELLRNQPPGLQYEVVNAGISGLNSELALRRLESVVPALAPDVVTIYIGWNDLMKFDPSGQSNSDRWAGVARALDQLWLVKGLRKLIFYYLRPELTTPAVGEESRTGQFADFRPTVFEGNLRGIISEVRRLGARPLVATLPTVVRPGMSENDLREAHVVFPYFSSAYGIGDFLDLISAYNDTIRSVSSAEGVPLADLAKRFAAIDDVRPLFYDTMHATDSGMDRIAAELLLALHSAGLLGNPVTYNAASASVQ